MLKYKKQLKQAFLDDEEGQIQALTSSIDPTLPVEPSTKSLKFYNSSKMEETLYNFLNPNEMMREKKLVKSNISVKSMHASPKKVRRRSTIKKRIKSKNRLDFSVESTNTSLMGTVKKQERIILRQMPKRGDYRAHIPMMNRSKNHTRPMTGVYRTQATTKTNISADSTSKSRQQRLSMRVACLGINSQSSTRPQTGKSTTYTYGKHPRIGRVRSREISRVLF